MKTSHRLTIAVAFAASVVALIFFFARSPEPLSASQEMTEEPLGPLRSVLSAMNMEEQASSWVGMFVEIPRGMGIKYKYEETTGSVQFEKALPPSVQFPGEYGVVPGTRMDDGELLEVIVVGQLPTFPGVFIQARPIGLIRMRNEDKVQDDKVIALPALDPSYNEIKDITDLPLSMREEVAGFFRTYTNLDGKLSAVMGWGSADDARKVILHARSAYGRLKSWER